MRWLLASLASMEWLWRCRLEQSGKCQELERVYPCETYSKAGWPHRWQWVSHLNLGLLQQQGWRLGCEEAGKQVFRPKSWRAGMWTCTWS